MEENQPTLTEEQQLARLFADPTGAYVYRPPADASASVVPPIRVRRRSPYRYVALLIAGVLCYALLISLAALAWGSLVYMRQGDVAADTAMPLAIFLGAIFLSSCLVTALSRGGTIFPALMLAMAANIISFLLAQAPQPQAKGVLMKLGLTLIVAVAGFVISKLLYMRGRAKQNSREKAA